MYHIIGLKRVLQLTSSVKMNSLTLKKLLTILGIVALDVGVLVLIWFYDDYLWYLFIISMGNFYKVIIMGMLLVFYGVKTVKQRSFKGVNAIDSASTDIEQNSISNIIGIVIPCYTESKDLLLKTITSCHASLIQGANTHNIKPLIIVVCDGKAQGAKSDAPTFTYVQDTLSTSSPVLVTYQSWKSKQVQAELSSGVYNGVPYVVCTKLANQGKKDSLILVRELTKALNTKNNEDMNDVEKTFTTMLGCFGYTRIDYLAGTDAGTRFDTNTISELYKSISENDAVIGVSGMVLADHLAEDAKWYNWLYLIQAMEYITLQAMTRLGQSFIGKVTCLPGCVQMFRMNEVTLGNALDNFKKLPSNSLLSQVRAFLGEDRRYTCLCLYEDVSARTLLNVNAYAYTDVPTTWKVFLSQRRRWFLSANANNINDTMTSKLPVFIRFIAFVQLWCTLFVITNMVCGARILWIIKETNSLTLLIAFSVYILTFVFKTGMAVRFSRSIPNFLYNMCSIVAYLVVGPIVNVVITAWGIWTIDDFSWGLTQETQGQEGDSSVQV
jgi:chitin synthase